MMKKEIKVKVSVNTEKVLSDSGSIETILKTATRIISDSYRKKVS